MPDTKGRNGRERARATPSEEGERPRAPQSASGRRTVVIVLALLAAVAAGGVLILPQLQQGKGPDPISPQALFPELADRSGSDYRITISNRDRATELSRQEGEWRVRQLDGYPAQADHIDELIRRIEGLDAAAVIEESRNSTTDYGVRDPSAGGTSTEVTLEDENRQPLVRLVIGHEAAAVAGETGIYTHVRRNDDTRIWLVEGQMHVSADPLWWVNSRIADVPRADVVAVEAETSGKEILHTRRTGDGAMELVEAPVAAADIAGPWVLERLTTALEDLRFEAVNRRSDDSVPDRARSFTATTVEGMAYRLRFWFEDDIDHRAYAVVSASVEETAQGPDEEGAPGARSAEELKARAASFNRRHEGWVYTLPALNTGLVSVSTEDML